MAADSDNEMYDVTDSEEERELLAEKAGIGLIKVQAIQLLRTEHLRKGYLPLKCVFLVTFSLSTNHTGPLSEGSTATNWSELGKKFEMKRSNSPLDGIF